MDINLACELLLNGKISIYRCPITKNLITYGCSYFLIGGFRYDSSLDADVIAKSNGFESFHEACEQGYNGRGEGHLSHTLPKFVIKEMISNNKVEINVNSWDSVEEIKEFFKTENRKLW